MPNEPGIVLSRDIAATPFNPILFFGLLVALELAIRLNCAYTTSPWISSYAALQTFLRQSKLKILLERSRSSVSLVTLRRWVTCLLLSVRNMGSTVELQECGSVLMMHRQLRGV